MDITLTITLNKHSKTWRWIKDMKKLPRVMVEGP